MSKGWIPPHLIAATALALTLGLALAPSCATHNELSSEMGGGGGMRAPAAIPASTVVSPDQLDIASQVAYHFTMAQSQMSASAFAGACLEYTKAVTLGTQLPEPILRLTQIRAKHACALNQTPINSAIGSANESVPKWLDEEWNRASIALANLRADAPMAALALFNLSGFERTSAGRVKRLQEALAQIGATDSTESSALRKKIRERLEAVAPRFVQRPSRQQWLRVAADYKQAREFDEARKYYGLVLADSTQTEEDRLKSLDGVRQTYKLQQNTDEYLAASKRWSARAVSLVKKKKSKRPTLADWKLFYETQVQYARALWTEHQRDYARTVLIEAEKKVGNRIATHDSRLIRARMEEELGNFAEMNNILETIDLDTIADRATRAKVFWFKGWNLRRLSQFDSAILNLSQGLDYEDSASAKTRSQYWIGRMLAQNGRSDESKKALMALATDNPFNIYGMLAHRELEISFTHIVPQNSKRTYLPTGLHTAVDWFVVLNELDVGRRYVESLSNESFLSVQSRDGTLEQKEEILTVFSQVGLHALVSQKLDELSPEDRTSLLNRRPDLMFPTPFLQWVSRESTRQKVEPALVYSIMRQESQFEPFARSSADAFGLMQLIPEAAKRIGSRVGITIRTPQELFEPEKNIALGTAFLGSLLERHQSRFILAVSSYNASERAIQGWLQTRFRGDPVEFLEEIPYDETRLYVKLVMRNFIAYKRRLDDQSFLFPKELLALPLRSSIE